MSGGGGGGGGGTPSFVQRNYEKKTKKKKKKGKIFSHQQEGEEKKNGDPFNKEKPNMHLPIAGHLYILTIPKNRPLETQQRSGACANGAAARCTLIHTCIYIYNNMESC